MEGPCIELPKELSPAQANTLYSRRSYSSFMSSFPSIVTLVPL